MKVAALGDIHANYQALIAVLDDLEAWNPDLVVVLGDTVNRGPRSKECYDLVKEKALDPAWKVIRGNHERYVLDFRDAGYSPNSPDFQLREIIDFTYRSLSEQDLDQISQLPTEVTVGLEGGRPLMAAHASSAGERIGIYPTTSALELADLIPEGAGLFLVGHTHQPLVRDFQGTTVVNAGSVGLPFDGDTRPGYARLAFQGKRWKGEIARVEYDREAAEEEFFSSGFIPQGGPLAELILAELRLGWPQLGRWFRKFEQPYRQGEISLQDAVYEFLKNPNIESRDSIYPR